MRHIVDYTVKIVLLFFIFARFLSGPAPDSHAPATAEAVHDPSELET